MQSYIEYLESLSKKQLMVLLARQRQEQQQGIAIVGMGCRFPGGLDSPQLFWQALREGRVVPATSGSSTKFSDGRPRWNFEAADLVPLAPLVRPGRYLENIDLFDAEFFGYQEEEVAYMDPQQRMLLEVTVQALADANLTRAELQRNVVGIFIGMSVVEYPYAGLRNSLRAGLQPSQLSPHLLNGSSLSAASSRIGLMLGVSGPAMTVDTASSSALTGIHLAIQSLRRRECDIAIVGASHLQMSPVTSAVLAKADVLSTTGNSLPFTASSDGFVRSEGCGVVLLKRARDAVSDIPYALIRGSAVQQHGNRLGLSVASGLGQQSVILEALKNAHLTAEEVQYVEAQANGLRIGAAVEVDALAAAYKRATPTDTLLYLGSCKANIGYMEIASGIAGLMKITLALAHQEIPPQVGADSLDSAIPWDTTSLCFAHEATKWPAVKRRVAGVSAFGVNGINAHVLVEALAPLATTIPQSRSAEEPVLLALSAHSSPSLAATAARLRTHLEHATEWGHINVCRTLLQGRDSLALRRAAVVRNGGELLQALSEWENADSDLASTSPSEENNQIALRIPELDFSRLKEALVMTRCSGMKLLETCISKNLDTMSLPPLDDLLSMAEPLPDGVQLAWAAGWLASLAQVGIPIAYVDFPSSHSSLIAQAIVESDSFEQQLEQWEEAGVLADDFANVGPHWRLSKNDAMFRLERQTHSCQSPPLDLNELAPSTWFGLLAERYQAGQNIVLATLFKSQEGGLLRLPGPVPVGKPHWPLHFQWH